MNTSIKQHFSPKQQQYPPNLISNPLPSSSPTTALQTFRYKYTSQIRRQKRTLQITKCRMRNLTSSSIFQSSEYQSVYTKTFTLSQAPTLLSSLHSPQSPLALIQSLIGIRTLLSQDQNYLLISSILNTPAHYDLILALSQDPTCIIKQIEANWILANLATGNTNQVNIMVKKGIFEHIIVQLKREVEVIDEEIVYLVGNIAGTGDEYKEMFVNNGTLELIVRLYERAKNQVRRSALWVVTNIMGLERCVGEETVELVVPLLVKELREGNDKEEGRKLVLNDIAWTLWKMTSKSRFACLVVIKQKAIQILIELAKTEPSIILACIRILGSVSLKLDTQIDHLITEGGIYSFMESLLSNQQPIIRKQTCWVLSNFSAGNSLQSTTLFSNTPLLDLLSHMFFHDSIDIRINVGWVLSNFFTKIPDGTLYLLFKRLVKGFIELCSDAKNVDALEIGVKGVHGYLLLAENFNVKKELEYIQNFEQITKIVYRYEGHPCKMVREKIEGIIAGFFEVESDNDDDDGMFV